MGLTVKRYFATFFIISVLLYFFIEYPYDIEIIFIISCIISIDILIKSIRFRIRRNNLIELGEQERFYGSWIGTLLFIAIIIALIFGIPKLEELGVLPEREERFHENFTFIVLMPQIIQFIIGIAFREMGQYMYVTEKGIIESMEVHESYLWEDFQSYGVLSDMKLIRFKKKNDKFLFIAYHEEHFNKHREHILTILGENLKREVE